MKIIIKILLIGMLFYTAFSSESVRHVPWCNDVGGHGNAGTAQCFGYATNRAYDREYNDSECPGHSIKTNKVPDNYFDLIRYEPAGITNFSDVQREDVITWNEIHAVYVSTKNYGSSVKSVIVDHKLDTGSGEYKNVPLEDVIRDKMHGANPTHIYRRADVFGYYVENSFNEGEILVNNQIPPKQSGSLIPDEEWESSQTIYAIEHKDYIYNGYVQLFHEWQKDNTPVSFALEYKFVIDWKYSTKPKFKAVFKNQIHVKFYNHFAGVEYNGKLKVYNTTYNDIVAANPFKIKQDTLITFEAINQSYNNIIYTFHHWDDQVTSRARNEYPNNHHNYTAYFIGKPTQISGFTWTCNTGEPISFSWSQHPNASVKYRIYRKTRDQYGHTTGPTLLATKNHDQTTFTDNLYFKASTYIYLVSYDVRAYYTVEQTEAASYYRNVYGDFGLAKDAEESAAPQTENSLVFQLHNFPNPFNPVTNIVYSLPEASTLKLNIYNSAGQRVRTLVNEFSPAGVHSVSWNGTNDQDVRVSSGVYFLIIELPSAIYKRKLVLLK